MGYGDKSPLQKEKEMAQELVKKYGARGSTEAVVGQPHFSPSIGKEHTDMWIIRKDERGKLGEPIKKPFPQHGG